MFKTTCSFLFSLMLFLSIASAKAESNTINLKLPENFATNLCPTARWKKTPLVFLGVKDAREEKQVGEQQQKNAEPLGLMTEPKLEQIFAEALKATLQTCGIAWTKSSEDIEYPTLSVNLEDFFAGSNKKWLTGKTSAHAQVSLTLIKQQQTSTTTITADIDSKKLRQKSIKQIQLVLNELFAETITQLVNIKELQELK